MVTNGMRQRLRLALAVGVSAFMTLMSAAIQPASAQEFRGTVTGTVTDPGGLPLPGATVTAVNTTTNETATAVTSGDGLYNIPFLKPGLYTVSVELEGFRKHTQDKVQLEVGSTITLAIQMQIGSISETVTVVSEAVEATKADRGMVIDNMRVTELPLNARNPFMLSYLAPGITYNGPAIYQRPFDNGAIADWSINGGANRNNEYLLDGAPNNSIQGGNNIAYVPPVDAVQEFKIVTNSYDAQYGRTAGGVVNVSLKSGANDLHGTVYEFLRRKSLDSPEYFLKVNNQPKPNHKLDQYGFEVDGPVRIPGIYDGRDKTFFMFAYEGYKELTPNPATYTVPDEAQLRGDFSNLRDAQGRLITIYDPSTGRLENGQWVRDAFPGNRIPDEPDQPGRAQSDAVFPAAELGGDDRRPVAEQLRVRAQPGRGRVPQLRHEGGSEHQQPHQDVLPLRLQQAHGDALHQRHHERPRAGRSAPAGTHQQVGRGRLGAHDELVVRGERPRRLEPVPRAGALRSRVWVRLA